MGGSRLFLPGQSTVYQESRDPEYERDDSKKEGDLGQIWRAVGPADSSKRKFQAWKPRLNVLYLAMDRWDGVPQNEQARRDEHPTRKQWNEVADRPKEDQEDSEGELEPVCQSIGHGVSIVACARKIGY